MAPSRRDRSTPRRLGRSAADVGAIPETVEEWSERLAAWMAGGREGRAPIQGGQFVLRPGEAPRELELAYVPRRGSPFAGGAPQAADEVVWGNPRVPSEENFRHATLRTNAQDARQDAIEYILSAFGDEELGETMGAVVRRDVHVGTRRRALADLSDATRRNYLGSRQAQVEAAAHGMSVEAWYEAAPNLGAFRRKRDAQRFEPRTFAHYETWYLVYITREYLEGGPVAPADLPSRLSQATRTAWDRWKASHGEGARTWT